MSCHCLAQVSGTWFSSRFRVLPWLQAAQVLFPFSFFVGLHSLLCLHCVFWAPCMLSLRSSVLVKPVWQCCCELPLHRAVLSVPCESSAFVRYRHTEHL